MDQFKPYKKQETRQQYERRVRTVAASIVTVLTAKYGPAKARIIIASERAKTYAADNMPDTIYHFVYNGFFTPVKQMSDESLIELAGEIVFEYTVLRRRDTDTRNEKAMEKEMWKELEDTADDSAEPEDQP